MSSTLLKISRPVIANFRERCVLIRKERPLSSQKFTVFMNQARWLVLLRMCVIIRWFHIAEGLLSKGRYKSQSNHNFSVKGGTPIDSKASGFGNNRDNVVQRNISIVDPCGNSSICIHMDIGFAKNTRFLDCDIGTSYNMLPNVWEKYVHVGFFRLESTKIAIKTLIIIFIQIGYVETCNPFAPPAWSSFLYFSFLYPFVVFKMFMSMPNGNDTCTIVFACQQNYLNNLDSALRHHKPVSLMFDHFCKLFVTCCMFDTRLPKFCGGFLIECSLAILQKKCHLRRNYDINCPSWLQHKSSIAIGGSCLCCTTQNQFNKIWKNVWGCQDGRNDPA